MARVMYLRIASVLGLFALAFLIVGLDPFLGADPTAGASFTNGTPAVVVNRSRKGDRLPIAPDWQSEFGSQPLTRPSAAPHAQIPVGCDPAFSPIASPAANVYRRCLT
jgi:hypothetical protein